MFSNISWQLFFTAIFVVIVLYYLFVGIVYFPKEILTFLLGKRNQVQPSIVGSPQTQDRQFTNIIGQSRDEQTNDDQYLNKFQSTTNFPAIEEEPSQQPADITLIESVSNLMEGIKTLFRVIKDAEGNKNDVVSLFPSLMDQYILIADSKYRYSINAYIYEICTEEYKYEITMQEVNALWPAVPPNQ